MGEWDAKNTPKIGSSEHIGRRLFQRPDLRGAGGQKRRTDLDYRDFLPTPDGLISLDRLGRSGIDLGVLSKLAPMAEAHGRGRTPARLFTGWAYIKAADLKDACKKKNYQLIVSPMQQPIINDYHCHITPPPGLDEMYVALYLVHTFARRGGIQPYDGEASLNVPSVSLAEKSDAGFIARLKQWVSERCRKIRRL